MGIPYGRIFPPFWLQAGPLVSSFAVRHPPRMQILPPFVISSVPSSSAKWLLRVLRFIESVLASSFHAEGLSFADCVVCVAGGSTTCFRLVLVCSV
uniref:Uncharacterized protein n=1 Tax=Arundo donax TaxID=35708 RepID=A0A0A8XY35_ARUDO